LDTTSHAAVKNPPECRVTPTRTGSIDASEENVAVRLLLVEDLPQMQGVVLDLLSTVGTFQLVEAASTEAEANLWLDEHPGEWDLAVIDLILEQGTGLGVVARAHRTSPACGKVVVFSDYASEGIRKHCLKLGADAAFQKGPDLQGFLAFCSAVAQSHPDS
jgi:DNA-binding NarL/FixJ family response regulator